MGFRPRGTLLRDLLSVSRMIDYWSQLGVQLHVTLAVPSSDRHDPLAHPDLEVDHHASRNSWNPALQAEYAVELLRLLTSKPVVTGIFWCHFRDSVPHLYPNSGLTDGDDRPKEALEVFRRFQHGETPLP